MMHTLLLPLLTVLALAGFLMPASAQIGHQMPARITYEGHATEEGLTLDTSYSVDIMLDPTTSGFRAQATVSYRYTLQSGCRLEGTQPLSGTISVPVWGAVAPRPLDKLSITVDAVSAMSPVIILCQDGDGDEDGRVSAGVGVGLFAAMGQIDLHDGATMQTMLVDQISGTTTLRLACSQPTAPPPEVSVTMVPAPSSTWPIDEDRTHTPAEIAALKREPGGLNHGLTQAKMFEQIALDFDTVPAAISRGVCMRVKEAQVLFPDVAIYIQNGIQPGSCHDRATMTHERKHYQAFVDLIRERFPELQEELRQDLLRASRFDYVYFVARAAGAEVFKRRVREAAMPWRNRVSSIAREESAELEQESAQVLASCRNWP